MKAKSFFAVLGIFAFLFVVGCSNETAVDNPTANNGGSIIDIAGKNGAVQADTITCGDCPNNDLQDNTIAPSTTAGIWISQASANACANAGGTVYYTIRDNPSGAVLANCVQAAFDGSTCGNNFVLYTFTVPATPNNSTSNSVSLTAYCGAGCVQGTVIGGDSFRILNNGNCDK